MKPTMSLHKIAKLELTPIDAVKPNADQSFDPFWMRTLRATDANDDRLDITLCSNTPDGLCLPLPCILPVTEQHERAGWLQTLIGAYQQEHDFEADPDPEATMEMLNWCRLILDEMAARLPAVPVAVAGVADDANLPF
jgi:hypothetical protein